MIIFSFIQFNLDLFFQHLLVNKKKRIYQVAFHTVLTARIMYNTLSLNYVLALHLEELTINIVTQMFWAAYSVTIYVFLYLSQ